MAFVSDPKVMLVIAKVHSFQSNRKLSTSRGNERERGGREQKGEP